MSGKKGRRLPMGIEGRGHPLGLMVTERSGNGSLQGILVTLLLFCWPPFPFTSLPFIHIGCLSPLPFFLLRHCIEDNKQLCCGVALLLFVVTASVALSNCMSTTVLKGSAIQLPCCIHIWLLCCIKFSFCWTWIILY
jgi:hypothetical protein